MKGLSSVLFLDFLQLDEHSMVFGNMEIKRGSKDVLSNVNFF